MQLLFSLLFSLPLLLYFGYNSFCCLSIGTSLTTSVSIPATPTSTFDTIRIIASLATSTPNYTVSSVIIDSSTAATSIIVHPIFPVGSAISAIIAAMIAANARIKTSPTATTSIVAPSATTLSTIYFCVLCII
jgi:hypothetical protein